MLGTGLGSTCHSADQHSPHYPKLSTEAANVGILDLMGSYQQLDISMRNLKFRCKISSTFSLNIHPSEEKTSNPAKFQIPSKQNGHLHCSPGIIRRPPVQRHHRVSCTRFIAHSDKGHPVGIQQTAQVQCSDRRLVGRDRDGIRFLQQRRQSPSHCPHRHWQGILRRS